MGWGGGGRGGCGDTWWISLTTRWLFSKTTTSSPASRSSFAATRPAGPAPTMATRPLDSKLAEAAPAIIGTSVDAERSI